MPRSVSRIALASGLMLVLSVLALGALVFYASQNASGRIGGEIAPQKMLWLLYAIVLWGVLPLAIVLDRRADALLRKAYAVLLLLMLPRLPVELWMLYVTHNWSPWYGIAHDVACFLPLAAFVALCWQSQSWRAAPNGWLFTHLVVTAAAFAPEIYFAHFMLRHFNTAGEAAIYFVPNDPRYAEVLWVTTAVVVSLSIYLPLFLKGYLFGPAGSKPTLQQ